MHTRPTPLQTATFLDVAIRHLGSQAKLGQATGRSQNAVWQARNSGRVTAEFALAIDIATDGAVPKEALRPDIYGAVPTKAAAA